MTTSARPEENGDRAAGRAPKRSPVPPAGAAIRHVAVVSDGSAPGAAGQGRPTEAALGDDVSLLEGLAQVPVLAHPVAAPDVEQIVTLIGQLPDSVAAVLLTRTDPARARGVQRRVEQAGGPPVLSDEDTRAIALTAAAAAYLRRLDRNPHSARILVAGVIAMPILTPLLIAAGFPDITMWNSVDAPRFPLRRAARDADVVLDVLTDPDPDTTPHADAAGLVMDRPEGSVINLSGLDGRLLVAPGLVRALVDHPAGTFELGLGLYQICAAAVAAATPPRYRLPDLLHDRVITATITDAIAAALHRASNRPEVSNRESRSSRRPGRLHNF